MTIKIGWKFQTYSKLTYEQTIHLGKGLQIQNLKLSAGSGRDAFNVDKVLAGQKANLLEPLNKTGIEIASISLRSQFSSSQ